MKDIRQKLLAAFEVEHRDHLEQIRSLLAMIEKTSGPPGEGALEEVFRRAHSLKGAARAVDLRPVEGMAHRLETLFSRVRHGEIALEGELIRIVQRALDAIEDSVGELRGDGAASGKGSSFADALGALEGALGMEPEKAKPAVPASEEPEPVPHFQPITTLRVTAQHFDGLLQSASGLLLEGQHQSMVTAGLKAMTNEIAQLEKEVRVERGKSAAGADALERRVRALSRQAFALRKLQQRSCWAVGALSKQLLRDVWQARMVPVEGLLEGYRKVVRDLARDEAKELDFRTESTGAHADRGVLERLKDPLMHALRNAVRHGIELPQERTAKGKARVGFIAVRVDAAGQQLTIAIEDDGRGVDFARVAETAVREGVLSEAEAAQSSAHELTRLLFRPGFSTAGSVTDLSGRGMGLSVVYEAVRRLHGEVEVLPREGAGTIVRFSVPLSISTHRVLLLGCGAQRFAIPVSGVEQLHRIKLKSVVTVEGGAAVMLDGQPVPLFTLSQLLGLDEGQPGQESLPVMVLGSKGRRTAVVVDAFLGETDAVIRDLGPATPRNGRISGGILLDDGTIALVLSQADLLQSQASAYVSTLLRPAEPAASPLPASILVADDSLTTRTLEKSILEAYGYRVRVAVDGMEALAQLRAEKADLLITDVQMPRMDGFGLLEAVKQDPSLNKIPVIIVTSLEHRDDQERGMSLGADAYIVKRKFDQGELLATIRQIL